MITGHQLSAIMEKFQSSALVPVQADDSAAVCITHKMAAVDPAAHCESQPFYSKNRSKTQSYSKFLQNANTHNISLIGFLSLSRIISRKILSSEKSETWCT